MDDQLDGLKQWKCKNGHVLGVVERVKVKVDNARGAARHVSRLMLFRHAIDLREPHPEEVDVIGALEGTMLHIRCDFPGCGEVRPWEIGADALERLMEKITPPPTPPQMQKQHLERGEKEEGGK